MPIKLIECPRDAMQGIHAFIDTKRKVEYLNQLLEVGFDTLDCGSFVSPKAIPQMRDSAEVLAQLNPSSSTKLLTIVANLRGAVEACKFPSIHYLGFPFSISETFQQRNANSSIHEALLLVKQIQELCVKHQKELVIYISMGFGNPYGDPWNAALVAHWVKEMNNLGIKIISLSDTVGVAEPDGIQELFSALRPQYPQIEFGAHLHTRPDTWEEKLSAAWEGGCRRFDSALRGLGGCPMADDQLTGNMATENLLTFLHTKGELPTLNHEAFNKAMEMTQHVFPS